MKEAINLILAVMVSILIVSAFFAIITLSAFLVPILGIGALIFFIYIIVDSERK